MRYQSLVVAFIFKFLKRNQKRLIDFDIYKKMFEFYLRKINTIAFIYKIFSLLFEMNIT